MIGALLGAIGTIGSGILGANAADNAAEWNYQANLLNYYQREREREQAINMAREQEADSKLGSRDASGNTTRFVEGVGWVSTLGEEDKERKALYRQEELQQLQNDLPKQRKILNRNIERQGKEDSYSQALFDAIGRIQRGSDTQNEQLLNASATKGINEGFDSVTEEALRSGVRSGASNTGKVAAAIAAKKASALSDAFLNNKINSRGQADDDYTREVGNMTNLYGMFSQSAAAMPGIQYNPRNIEGLAAQQQGGAVAGGAAANGALLNAIAKQGGTLQGTEPNYGWANALQQGGGALKGMFDSVRADAAKQDAMGTAGAYGGLPPEMFKQNIGWW